MKQFLIRLAAGLIAIGSSFCCSADQLELAQEMAAFRQRLDALEADRARAALRDKMSAMDSGQVDAPQPVLPAPAPAPRPAAVPAPQPAIEPYTLTPAQPPQGKTAKEIIAEEEKHLGLLGGDGLPNRLWQSLLAAAAKCDAR